MRLTHVACSLHPKAGGDAAVFSGGSAREGAYPENELDAGVGRQLPAGEILVADAGSHTIKVACRREGEEAVDRRMEHRRVEADVQADAGARRPRRQARLRRRQGQGGGHAE